MARALAGDLIPQRFKVGVFKRLQANIFFTSLINRRFQPLHRLFGFAKLA